MSNTVVITGHCTSLTVSGMRNSVTVDSVGSNSVQQG
ncbi:membrane protein [Mycobacterium tuberculosis]|nr:membrane protein [Mycobacterium tuberculosis]